MRRNLSQGVDLYLKTRREFGFGLVQAGRELQSFLRYVKEVGHRGPLSTSLAVRWAQQPQHCQRHYWALRLEILRRFAQFWTAYDPRTQMPPRGLLGPTYRRRVVHIYTRQEVGALLEMAAQVGGREHPFRGSSYCALLALLDCTGLRIGEALALRDQDIDWSEAILTIPRAKYGHARLIPVQASTLEALRRYRILRDKSLGSLSTPRFFATFRGEPLGYHGVNSFFRVLRRRLGWTQRPIPRLHDLRHSFAVRTLLAWNQSDQPVGPKLWSLSTYLGHRHLADTYWYLTAVPELMHLIQQRFAAAQAWASSGAAHE